MDDHGHHGAPHEPAPPEPRRLIPEGPLLIRGLGLVAVAAAFGWLAAASLQKGGWLFSPLSAAFSLSALLAGWAALIHLTGGEKFDDHPFV
jgi:hypothetical protein